MLISENYYDKLKSENRFLNVKRFQAKIKILHHQSTIRAGYCPVLHIDNIRQSASIIEIYSTKGKKMDCLRTGDVGIVIFQFVKKSEFLKPNKKLLFRDGRAKGTGFVTETY